MPRTYKNKNVHTKPSLAGAQNLVGKDLPKDEDGIMKKIMPIYLKGKDNKATYNGNWNEENLTKEITDFFTHCAEYDVKPTQPALRIWLSISREQMNDWKNDRSRYGVKSDIIREALEIMEFYLQSNIDKYPTGSIFLLKTSHGHVEQNRLDITSNGMAMTPKADEIEQSIKMLGLDEKHE